MSSQEDDEAQGSSFEESYSFEKSDSESGPEDDSNSESHEVRLKVYDNVMAKLQDMPMRASHDPNVLHTVSHFKETDFMPEGSEIEVEAEPHEDEDGEEVWNVFYSYATDKYRIEVRVDHEEDDYFIVQVFHKPHLRIVNSGHLYSGTDVKALCLLLEEGSFGDAMSMLFRCYGGGVKDRQERNAETLNYVREECNFRTTNSAFEL